jgi:hypothetical protein
MTNATAAAIALASGAHTWVVIVVILLTNEHTTTLLSGCWADVIDVFHASRGKKWTKRVARLRGSRHPR